MLALYKLEYYYYYYLEFLDEYRQILAPIAVTLDRLQGEKDAYYATLMPTLFTVNTQLTQ